MIEDASISEMNYNTIMDLNKQIILIIPDIQPTGADGNGSHFGRAIIEKFAHKFKQRRRVVVAGEITKDEN